MFVYGVIDEFLDLSLLNDLLNDVQQIPVEHKVTDIYSMGQSMDLQSFPFPSFQNLKSKLYNHFKADDLDPLNIDASVSVYSQGDFLLPHDDAVGTRRIAYILYLVSDWVEEDGGALQLYKDNAIFEQILPKKNRLVWFFVESEVTFHSVQQVLTEKQRISINGWLHHSGKPFEEPVSPFLDSCLVQFDPLIGTDVNLQEWINPLYLKHVGELNGEFASKSVLRLDDFLLNPEVELNFVRSSGPLSLQRWKYAERSSLEILFSSNQFKKWLNDVSGIEVQQVKCAVRKFNDGDYVLAHHSSTDTLDLCLGLKTMTENNGGCLVYLRNSVLLQEYCTKNSLLMVFRDPGVQYFIQRTQERLDMWAEYK